MPDSPPIPPLRPLRPAPRIALDRYDQSAYRRGRSLVVVMLWEVVQRLLIRTSLHPMYGWRRFWYRVFGARIGRHVLIRRTATCTYPWKVNIGDHAWIGDDATIYSLDEISIGSHAVVSQQAYLCTGSHDHTDPHFGLRTAPIAVGHGAWIALGALIMPGVEVGEGAVIAARAVLTGSARPWTIYRGIPAVAVGDRVLKDPPATPGPGGPAP